MQNTVPIAIGNRMQKIGILLNFISKTILRQAVNSQAKPGTKQKQKGRESQEKNAEQAVCRKLSDAVGRNLKPEFNTTE